MRQLGTLWPHLILANLLPSVVSVAADLHGPMQAPDPAIMNPTGCKPMYPEFLTRGRV